METLLDAGKIERVISDLATDILSDPALDPERQGLPIAVVGIRSRGELIAQRLAKHLAKRHTKHPIDVGALDITMYRDDLASRRAITIPQGTEMNFRLDDRALVLVDDVLETGRSVRAALDAVVDFGRPRFIRLAVLIDRGGREFPIAADYVGVHLPETKAQQKVVVHLKPTDEEDAVYLSEEQETRSKKQEGGKRK